MGLLVNLMMKFDVGTVGTVAFIVPQEVDAERKLTLMTDKNEISQQ